MFGIVFCTFPKSNDNFPKKPENQTNIKIPYLILVNKIIGLNKHFFNVYFDTLEKTTTSDVGDRKEGRGNLEFNRRNSETQIN